MVVRDVTAEIHLSLPVTQLKKKKKKISQCAWRLEVFRLSVLGEVFFGGFFGELTTVPPCPPADLSDCWMWCPHQSLNHTRDIPSSLLHEVLGGNDSEGKVALLWPGC